MLNRIPRATYRIQLRSGFGFEEVRQLTDYLEALGISDIYLSPLFRARKDSSHGYDVVDHAAIEPEFGDLTTFYAMARQVRARGMGILLDVVPNHMGINDPGNRWWHDVLKNGALSRYANHFDIDWERVAENLRDKVLLPTLGDHFGKELEQGRIQIGYQNGQFHVDYCGTTFPIAPDTWPGVLRFASEQMSGGELADELHSLSDQLLSLSPRSDRTSAAIATRDRIQHDIIDRLRNLISMHSAVQAAIDGAVATINGNSDDPHSFDELERLLNQQWYRLAYWRTAADEINYRRFFDINELAAIRVEEDEVFIAVHALANALLQEDLITGLRIDHPDGLLNPPQYFENLQRMFQQHFADTAEPAAQLYVVVEKILTGEEPLSTAWSVAGTTGYELLNDINRLLVDGPGLETLRSEYSIIMGSGDAPAQLVYDSKKQILAESMASEIHMLAGRLHRLTQRHRMSRDFTYTGLLRALSEVIACFPVYRTYVPPQGWDVDEVDYGRVMTAVRWAKLRNPAMDWSTLDFIASVLLLQFPPADEPDREAFRDFVLRFQQITGPVTAKGIEDTAFYRYFPLAALNEVGGELHAEAYTAEDFHRRMQHRAADWPHGLSATATHDTKRGEDLRARLLVLSEIAEPWHATVRKWQELNRPHLHLLHEAPAPTPNEEYLLYQTLVGTWPGGLENDAQRDAYTERIAGYMQKALREAKLNTSWANPSAEHENAVLDFTRELLSGEASAKFLPELATFVERIANAGFINGLTQVILKATVPGVPDFYQGCELWDFNLVDPDNRRPVDYALRRQCLTDIQTRFARDPAKLLQSLVQAWPDARIKLLVTWRLLQMRAAVARLFEQGDYVPLATTGGRAEHLLAFARHFEDQWCITIVPLQVEGLLRRADQKAALQRVDWNDTTIELPPDAPRQWRCALTQNTFSALTDNGTAFLPASQVLSPLPMAVLCANQ